MMSMNEFVDLRMQQQIAHEIYRQQIMQRIPDPFPAAMMPMPMHGMAAAMAAHHMLMPPARPTLPGCEAKLENRDLWQQFHKIGSEMIITKTGRRMFPSMRVSLSGLEDESSYCVLLEMVPIGDCRYKFSGSQWVPAGGAEPQSPQRMYLHPDSPATGAHWQAQALLFNKVKLTNNTLDSNGHIVLASMHKYQPRLHVIRTSDLTQLPWAPQQAFVFPETEFVAVTAYQNDRITKLKIDNNPFAKGFRETGQSRCKRKMNSSDSSRNNATDSSEAENLSRPDSLLMSSLAPSTTSDDDRISVCSLESPPRPAKRMRHSHDEAASYSSSSSSSCSGSISPRFDEMPPFYHHPHQHHQQQPHGHFTSAAPINLAAHPHALPFMMPPGALLMEPPRLAYAAPAAFVGARQLQEPAADAAAELERSPAKVSTPPSAASTPKTAQPKRNNFSISAILAY